MPAGWKISLKGRASDLTIGEMHSYSARYSTEYGG